MSKYVMIQYYVIASEAKQSMTYLVSELEARKKR